MRFFILNNDLEFNINYKYLTSMNTLKFKMID
jgi:hypothetical protein